MWLRRRLCRYQELRRTVGRDGVAPAAFLDGRAQVEAVTTRVVVLLWISTRVQVGACMIVSLTRWRVFAGRFQWLGL